MARRALAALAIVLPLLAAPAGAGTKRPSREEPPEALGEKDLVQRIRALLGRKQFPEAIRAARVLEERYPGAASVPKVRSDIYVRIGRSHRKRYGEAAAVYEAYLAAFADSPLADAIGYKIAFCYERAKRFPDAERAYRQLLDRHPGTRFRGDSLLRLSEIRRAQSDFAGMASYADRIVTESPQSPAAVPALFLLADSDRLEEPDRALVLYGRILERRDRLPAGLVERALLGLGDVQMARRDYAAASEAFRRAARETGSREGAFKRARCLELAGQTAEARAVYLDLVRRDPWGGRARERVLGAAAAVAFAGRTAAEDPLDAEIPETVLAAFSPLPEFRGVPDAGRRADAATEARILARPDALRIAWRLLARPPKRPEGPRRGKPPEGTEVLEIDLDPGPTYTAFFRIQVGPDGLLSADRLIAESGGKPPRPVTAVSWPGSGKVGAAVRPLGEGLFRGEVDVPWESLGGAAPAPGEHWGFNVIRTRKGPGGERSSLFPYFPRDPDPAHLGTLVFE